MNNEMYLIQREDYIKHIDEKVQMYGFVKQLVHGISKLPATKGNKAVKEMAVIYGKIIEEQFASWGIPGSYLVTGDAEELTELMENELIEPEEAGFYPCDSGCAGNCPCCEAEDDEADEDEDFSEMLETLSALIHDVFGDNVSVHIVLE